ncbi:Hypothetical protein KQS_05940 [Flavobacterium indicum GPTSA100-9 = DSM 17447]|uniref:Lipoprotein n=1 Tax=Flavobacterium indicum (strain DSM 17447 / CIP 109464 / GPTSA100-9) TaxID=1094466 RepID=H8XP78_FLAIG|nr:hypothetical protein [Flavobacterium indicum]CCG53152.1 Hypothetical protein KQS_05940 [Flavobacterium indicum GPTSA100-9 = DSM 17447]
MKKIFFILSIISNLIFVSCNRDFNLETNNGTENTKQKIIETFGSKKRVHYLKINTYSSFFEPTLVSTFHDATIYFKENDKTYSQTLVEQNLENPLEQKHLLKLKIEPEVYNSFEIGQIKFEDIPIKVIEAKKMIEKQEKFTSLRLANWETHITKNNKIINRFRILCNLKKPELVVFSYETYDFIIDENGKLKKVDFGK